MTVRDAIEQAIGAARETPAASILRQLTEESAAHYAKLAEPAREAPGPKARAAMGWDAVPGPKARAAMGWDAVPGNGKGCP